MSHIVPVEKITISLVFFLQQPLHYKESKFGSTAKQVWSVMLSLPAPVREHSKVKHQADVALSECCSCSLSGK